LRPFIRLGDSTDHGGIVVSASAPDLIEGKPIARVGDTVTCPIPGHGSTVIVTGDPGTIIAGQPAARHGDQCACGAILLASQNASGTE
jgi:uncharacterized Zn-binding protein involved in type VI secretion